MTREAALAQVATAALKHRWLLQYIPGESLVVNRLIGGADVLVVDEHEFEACTFKSVDGKGRGYGYQVDVRA